MLTILDQLEVQIVVLLDKALVLLLERHHGLAVEAGLVCDHCVLVLELLEGLSSLKHLIEESLDESGRFNV